MTCYSIESMYFVEKERNYVLADYQLKLVIISFEQVFLQQRNDGVVAVTFFGFNILVLPCNQCYHSPIPTRGRVLQGRGALRPLHPTVGLILLQLLTESFNFAEVSRFLLKFIWNEYSVKNFQFLVLQEFMVLGPIFRQVVGSKFCPILNFLIYTCIIYR